MPQVPIKPLHWGKIATQLEKMCERTLTLPLIISEEDAMERSFYLASCLREPSIKGKCGAETGQTGLIIGPVIERP